MRSVWLISSLALAACFSESPDVEDAGNESGTSTPDASITGNPDGSETRGAEDTDESGAGPDDTAGDTAADDTAGTTSFGDTGAASSGGQSCECATSHCDDDGTCARYVFVTSVAHPSDFGGVAEADDICAAEADGVLDGEFVAFVRSNALPDPWDHIDYDGIADAVFIRPDGVQVAGEPEQLRADVEPFTELDAPIQVNVLGEVIDGQGSACNNQVRVWTGLRREIEVADTCDFLDTDCIVEPAGDCEGWGDAGAAMMGGTGSITQTDVRWLGNTSCQCGDIAEMAPATAHLYCVEMP